MILLALTALAVPFSETEDFVRSVVNVQAEGTKLALRDMDGDGGLDIVFVDDAGLAVRFLQADGTYASGHDAKLAWPSTHVAWSLVDGDGDGATEVTCMVDGAEVRSFTADPAGGFDDGTRLHEVRGHLPRGIYRMSFFRDVDADGRLDLIVPAYGRYSIHRRLVDGWAKPLEVELEIEVDYAMGDPEELDSRFGQSVEIPWFKLEDVDGDGDTDLIAETEDEVYFHLADPELSGEPTWTLDVQALRDELPENDGIDFDDLLSQGARIVDWQLHDLDGEGARDLVVQVGSKFRVYPGGSVAGPVGKPGQVLKSSGNVLCFYARDVQGDELPDLQLMRAQSLSLTRILRWLVLPGSFDLTVFTYRNEGGSFSRKPTRENTLSLEFPRLLSFIDDLEALEEELEEQEYVPARRAALDADGEPNDVVDLRDGALVIYADKAPAEKAPTEELDDSDFEAFLEKLVLADLDRLEDGGTKTIDLGDIDEWLQAPGIGLREACAGVEPDRRVPLEGDLEDATIYLRDLDQDGSPDFVVSGKDGEGNHVLQFLVGTRR